MIRTQRIEDVGRIGGVEDGELRGQGERLRVLADDLVRDGVKRAAADPLGPA